MIWPNLRWWIVDAGTQRQQWAHLEPGGKVAIYDARGKLLLRTKYRHRFEALAALRRRGFRRSRMRDGVHPPAAD